MGLFDTGKPNKRLAKIISIESPKAFKKSIKELKKGGLTTEEKRALVLARNRAGAMLNKKNLSFRERMEMTEIKNMEI